MPWATRSPPRSGSVASRNRPSFPPAARAASPPESLLEPDHQPHAVLAILFGEHGHQPHQQLPFQTARLPPRDRVDVEGAALLHPRRTIEPPRVIPVDGSCAAGSGVARAIVTRPAVERPLLLVHPADLAQGDPGRIVAAQPRW